MNQLCPVKLLVTELDEAFGGDFLFRQFDETNALFKFFW